MQYTSFIIYISGLSYFPNNANGFPTVILPSVRENQAWSPGEALQALTVNCQDMFLPPSIPNFYDRHTKLNREL